MSEVLLKNSLTVTVDGGTYEFKIPTIFDEIGVGIAVKKLHKKAEPDWDGLDGGIDYMTFLMLQSCATFEVLLRASSEEWPYVKDAQGKPTIDSTKFPPEHAQTVMDVYTAFREFPTLVSWKKGFRQII